MINVTHILLNFIHLPIIILLYCHSYDPDFCNFTESFKIDEFEQYIHKQMGMEEVNNTQQSKKWIRLQMGCHWDKNF